MRQSPREQRALAGLASRALNREFVELLRRTLDFPANAIKTYSKGQTVLQSWQRAHSLPVVESGAVEVVVTSGDRGQRVVPTRFERGELALPSLLFSSQPVLIDLVAARPTRLRWLPRPQIERAVTADFRLALALLKFFAQRLREAQRREQGWMDRGVRERVIAALARAIRDAGPPAEGAPLRIYATHQELAERSGVSRPKLSGQLKLLERAGAIRLGRGQIEVLDASRILL